MPQKKFTFLDMFPDHMYRYIDTVGCGRPPISTDKINDELNINGYASYFTVNGFRDKKDGKRESCTSINAFFVDIDGRKDEAELEKIHKLLDPTFIVETFHGYHIYWILDEPIYKDEVENWDEIVDQWEKTEESLVRTLNGDTKAMFITNVLRIPDKYYWVKGSGEEYKKGTKGVFKIKGIYKNLANTYSMKQVAEVFPSIKITEEKNRNAFSAAEKKNFFDKVNKTFPIEERDSFQALISGKANVFVGERNHALHVVITLMRDAGWSLDRAIEHIKKTGWYGMEKERGWEKEISGTIKSAFNNPYHYSYKDEVIFRNMTAEEQIQMKEVYAGIFKERKEDDKLRFLTYEREVLARYPHLRKNEIGLVFNYYDGVYKLISDQEVNNMILKGLDEDMLWLYRTKKNIADKVQCLLSIIPDLNITEDQGHIINIKNGLLNTETKELEPHTPEFISLVQFPVSYDAEATCPVWTSCMDDWMDGPEKEDKKLLLQQFAGYILSSSMLHDKALFLVGDGANGKSTFIDTLSMIIGRNATSHIDLEGLYSQFGMKGLIGKRLNIIEEVHNNYYQSNKLKKLISGEPQTIDIKHKDQFSFRPQTKFVFAVNIMPRVDDTSTATERRICAVVFRNNFRNNPNIQLRGEGGLLVKEKSGILNWMIEGMKILKEKKTFIVTNEQIELLAEYRQENSSVEGFIVDCLTFSEKSIVETNDLYDEYRRYCNYDGRKAKAKITFTKEMKSYGRRHLKFSFIERAYNAASSSFEGISINNNWSRNAKVEHEFHNDW